MNELNLNSLSWLSNKHQIYICKIVFRCFLLKVVSSSIKSWGVVWCILLLVWLTLCFCCRRCIGLWALWGRGGGRGSGRTAPADRRRLRQRRRLPGHQPVPLGNPPLVSAVRTAPSGARWNLHSIFIRCPTSTSTSKQRRRCPRRERPFSSLTIWRRQTKLLYVVSFRNLNACRLSTIEWMYLILLVLIYNALFMFLSNLCLWN